MNADDLATLRDELEAHGLWANKGLGQHFLLDLNITRRIAKGGSYLMTAADARAARLLKFHAEARSAAIGVRFAAALDAPTR